MEGATIKAEYSVKRISYQETKPWILGIHYAHRMPSISFAFGLFHSSRGLVGIISYGSPASPFLCKGVCGEKYRQIVLELNRLVLKDNIKNEASFLIAHSLKMLPTPRIVVSYADTGQGHFGYVYQATNWLYTGKTKKRTDIRAKNGKHSRHNLGDTSQRQIRTSKHRYIKFLGSKSWRKKILQALRYSIELFPKKERPDGEEKS